MIYFIHGWVAERFIAPNSKFGVSKTYRGFKSHPNRQVDRRLKKQGAYHGLERSDIVPYKVIHEK